jgi:hypothetical protein
MDVLSHLFLPLTAVYVLRRGLFDSPWMFGLAGFGLLSDFDKFLGVPGLLHSLVTLLPVCVAILGAEYWLRGELEVAPVVVALVASHLLLDLLDGGPVPLLFPLVETGIGLEYPVRTVFGEGLLGVRLDGPLVSLRTAAPRPDNRTYGFIRGGGVASALLFGLLYVSDRCGGWRRARSTVTGSEEPPETAEDDSHTGR